MGLSNIAGWQENGRLDNWESNWIIIQFSTKRNREKRRKVYTILERNIARWQKAALNTCHQFVKWSNGSSKETC